ncbi:MAG: hypothetical protein NVS2B3_17360 [Vulcanimicrobiaceae bacterium]
MGYSSLKARHTSPFRSLAMTTTYVKPEVLVSLKVTDILAESFGGSGSSHDAPVVCGLPNATGRH